MFPSAILSLALLATTLQAKDVVVEERASSANPDSSVGTALYVTEPACGSYKCIITWPLGLTVSVNWVNPPPGNVSISLASNVGGPTYTIVDSYPSISQEGYCDSGSGLGVVNPGTECGQVQFDVPLGWTLAANYTIVVQSLSDSSLVGYTDAIALVAANSSSSTSAPTGTIVSLLTIPSPTSTNLGASTQFSGTIPSHTAVTGTAVTSAVVTSASGSKAGSGSSSGSGSTAAGSSTTGSGSATLAAASASASATVGPKVGAANSILMGSRSLGAGLMVGLVGVTMVVLA